MVGRGARPGEVDPEQTDAGAGGYAWGRESGPPRGARFFQGGPHAGRQGHRVVPSLEDPHHPTVAEGIGPGAEEASEGAETIHRDAQTADRIPFPCVETGGDQEELGAEFPDQRLDPMPCFQETGVVGAGIQRKVEGEARAWSLSPLLGGAAAGIERGTMAGDESHVSTAPEDRLRAVPMVDVLVQDHHPFAAAVGDCVGGRDRDTVEQAKTGGVVGAGVMPGGTNQSEGAAAFPDQASFGGAQRGSSGEPRGGPGFGTGSGIGIELGVSLQHRILQSREQIRTVDSAHALMGSERRNLETETG